MAQSKAWIVVNYDYTNPVVPIFNRLHEKGVLRYAIVGEEVCPSTGRNHQQCYTYWTKKRTLRGVKDLLFPNTSAHIGDRDGNPCFGSPRDNAIYCSKTDPSKIIIGTEPPSPKECGAKGGARTRKNWEEARALAKEGRFDEIDADIAVAHYLSLKAIHKDHPARPEHLVKPCGLWVHGVPGSGKSFWTRQQFPGAYDKIANKWFDGYRGEDVIIIDDLDTSHTFMSYFLKRWADQYPFTAESKGGSMCIRPKTVIVTSQFRIEDIWIDWDTRQALLRRFQVVPFRQEFRNQDIESVIKAVDPVDQIYIPKPVVDHWTNPVVSVPIEPVLLPIEVPPGAIDLEELLSFMNEVKAST